MLRVLLIDKSVLQGIAYDKFLALSHNWQIVFPRILAAEVIADARKVLETRAASNKALGILQANAGKLLDSEARMLPDHPRLSTSDLLGDHPSVGTLLSMTLKQDFPLMFVALNSVVEGDLSDQLINVAKSWESTLSHTAALLHNLGKSFDSKFGSTQRLKSLADLEAYTNHFMATAEPEEMLDFVISRFAEASSAPAIRKRWRDASQTSLGDFAPYAFHCCRACVLFEYALWSELVRTGKHAKSFFDLYYLYYLPLCDAFASQDRLHHRLAPMLMGADQTLFTDIDGLLNYSGDV